MCVILNVQRRNHFNSARMSVSRVMSLWTGKVKIMFLFLQTEWHYWQNPIVVWNLNFLGHCITLKERARALPLFSQCPLSPLLKNPQTKLLLPRSRTTSTKPSRNLQKGYGQQNWWLCRFSFFLNHFYSEVTQNSCLKWHLKVFLNPRIFLLQQMLFSNLSV